jgi:UDP-arabinose 4-epimerase
MGPIRAGRYPGSQRLDAVLRRYRQVAILRCAGVAYVGESVMDPASYYDNNVTESLVLEAVRAAGIDCVVFSSS